jgi:hypothetical protein
MTLPQRRLIFGTRRRPINRPTESHNRTTKRLRSARLSNEPGGDLQPPRPLKHLNYTGGYHVIGLS